MANETKAPGLDVGVVTVVDPNAKRHVTLPYLLLLPATALIVIVLGYPIFRMITLSLQDAQLRNLVQGNTPWNGFANYKAIFTDPMLWETVLRTIIFTAVCVVATMALGMIIALVTNRLGAKMRLLVTVGLLLAWATPAITATQIWQWLFDSQYGLVNWFLTTIGLRQFDHHDWLEQPTSLLGVAAIVVVWGALPFVVLTLYAGMSQIPGELMESAEVDGATSWKRFRLVTMPLLAPIITIVAALSTIWDFRVFTQVYILQKAGGITSETNLLDIYAYRQSFSANNFGAGAAISVVMVVLLIGLSAWYVRRMVREVSNA